MKTELSLPEIKLATFNILLRFSSFCEKNSIRFYLSNGTLLGAVKYGGFIPWDDDIDVFVPRKDYDRLIELYEDNDKFQLFSRERNENYKFTFAKLCDMTTLKVEKNIDNGVSLGIDIDIFPLDSCSAHILRPSVQRKIRICQTGCILSKFLSADGYPFYKRIIINFCRLLRFDFFNRRLCKIVAKERTRGDEFSGCLVWPIYGAREIIPSAAFSDMVDVLFEGEKFPAPTGYDTYLRSLYGDYENDPPLEKQKSHHNYTAYHR